MFDPAIHHRRSIRLRTHDYAAGGAYYITICVENRRRIFGTVVNGRMALNDAGRMIRDVWNEIPAHCPEYRVDEFVVMPDHFHGVVSVVVPADTVGAALRGRPCPDPASLSDFVYRFKSLTTKRYIDGVRQSGWPPFPGTLWQRNYYEHIVRDAADLARIRAYIRNNPANWDVLRYGEIRFLTGNRALLDLPKVAYLASRGGPRRGGSPWPPPISGECVISGFLSPLERAVFETCLADGTPMIRVLACRLPARFPPRVQRAIDAGRLLVMTPFGPEVTRINAERAAWCNQYLLHAADRVVIGHLNPDGLLACLLADMPARAGGPACPST